MQQEQLIEQPQAGYSREYWYNEAARQLFQDGRSEREVADDLMADGLSESEATQIILELRDQLTHLKKEKAKKDMLYGALWCVGGIVLTVANIGFIFWGAIIFGGIQFFRGVSNINGD